MIQVIEALQRGAAHESLVCGAAYLLGEYGRQVQQVPLKEQFALLQERFVTVSSEAKVHSQSSSLCLNKPISEASHGFNTDCF